MSAENIKITQEYENDKENFEKFVEHKAVTFNTNSLRRLVLSELSYKGAFDRYGRLCGFTRNQIIRMAQYPEQYGKGVVRLSQYMYLKSGYYKRLIDYFTDMAVINWTVDLTLKDIKINEKTVKTNYYKYVDQVNKFKLENRISDIMKKLFIEDICYGFVTETDTDISIYWIDSKYCEIKSIVNGNVYQYAINRSLLTDSYFNTLPLELQELLNQSKEFSLNNMVMIPYENSLCLKYNSDFIYPYPALFQIIISILDIDDYKDLAKAKTEADAYKLVCLEIPTTDDGQMSMGDEIVTPFTTMTKSIVPESWGGVVPTPMKMQLLESKSTASDDSNKVADAVENFYTECGISKALISSASSGSELKYSIKVDSSDIYRIYRMLESWVDLQMKLRGHVYKTYQFEYSILPTTVFDISDYIDTQLKLAQVSAPVKGRMLAANGINTAKLLGNSVLENSILKNVFESWTPLSTSYTQNGSDVNNQGGRPQKSEDDLTDSGTQTREDDENNKANRDV